MIGIINYGLGNLASVKNAFEYLGEDVFFINEKEDFDKATALVLPGVGNFKKGMHNLKSKGFIDILNDDVFNKNKYCLGICLGMQLMCSYSEEGEVAGLNWYPMKVKKINSLDLKTPNIGWSEVTRTEFPSLLMKDIPHPTFYFVHSYYVEGKSEYVTSKIKVDIEVAATLEKGNVMAAQFHPEKSQQDGLKVLENFIMKVKNG